MATGKAGFNKIFEYFVLMSAQRLPADFEEGIVRVIHKVRDDKPPVQIFPVLSASGQTPADNADEN